MAAGFRIPGETVLLLASMDQLVHGWDLAVATGHASAMPEDLARAVFDWLSGNISEAERVGGVFGAELAVPGDAPVQDRLLGYTGRKPV